MNESDLSDLTTGHLHKKPRLSDAIFFPTDIAPHPFVCIWADVGSGKNTFIEKMIAGCPDESIPRLTVLLITSRKAKVIETLHKYPNNVFGKLCDESNYGDIICEAPLPLGSYQHEITVDDWELTLTQCSVICTNAAIEKYLQYRHDPNDPCTHLWNRFDIIVWDEVHSLGIDSSYQSSPFHAMQLFKKTYQMMRMRSSGKLDPSNGIPYCKKLIMMTATPEPL